MEREDLRKQLAALHAALGDGESVGPEARELLQAVMDDIQRVLDIEEGEEQPEGLVDRLREADVPSKRIARQVWEVLVFMIWHGIFVEARITPEIPEPVYPVRL